MPWSDATPAYLTFNAARHEKLADEIGDHTVQSVLVLSDRLNEELWDNPKYMRKDLQILVSEFEEHIRKEIMNDYYTDEQILEFCKKYDLETESTSYTKAENRAHWSRLFDAFVELRHRLMFPSTLLQFERVFRVFDPETCDERPKPLTRTQLAEVWPAYLEKILMPRTSVTYKRLYNLPPPFNWWDDRNLWQHYFFVSESPGAPISYRHGGSASSGVRENHGLMSHTFATLSDRRGGVKTLVVGYSNNSVLAPIAEYDTFKTLPYELSGNYSSDRDTLDSLFKGKLITSTFNFDTGQWGPLGE